MAPRQSRVTLPEPHADQWRAFDFVRDRRAEPGHAMYDPLWARNSGGRFVAYRCGRRWGKTKFGQMWICEGASFGEPVGWFAPNYKYLDEVFEDVADILAPITRSINRSKKVIRLRGGGIVDFWSLTDSRAGRGRRYRRVVVDEAAFTGDNMLDIWKQSIKPTLLDYSGACKVLSNTNGVSDENFLWRICNQPEHEFIDFHAPSINNPLIPERIRAVPGGSNYEETEAEYQARREAYFANLQDREHPLVWMQEYLAKFVDWRGVAFFSLEKLLVGKAPVAEPTKCDAVYAVIDTAMKTGSDNDGTAVTYFALTRHKASPLVIIDWDYVQIEGGSLVHWLPGVFDTLEHWARVCGARQGSLGAWIEDASSGSVLLQQAAKRSLPARSIESALTSVGKDERAISVSGYVHREEVKIARGAYDKTVTFKQATRNHLVTQVTGFRIGDKDAARRADDLLDTFCYGIAIGLGNQEGF